MKVVCIGHSTFDTTLPVDEYPKENVKMRIKENENARFRGRVKNEG